MFAYFLVFMGAHTQKLLNKESFARLQGFDARLVALAALGDAHCGEFMAAHGVLPACGVAALCSATIAAVLYFTTVVSAV